MSLSVNGVTLSSTFIGGSSKTTSVAVASGLVNSYLLMLFSARRTSTPATSLTVTWNSVAVAELTFRTGGDNVQSIIHGLANPDSGTHDLVVTWNGGSGNQHGRIACVILEGVDQSSPIYAVAENNSNSQTISENIASLVGGLVVDVEAVAKSFGSGSDPVPDGSQTTVMAGQVQNNIRMGYGASYKPATGTPTTMAWDNINSTQHWAWSAVSLQPAVDSNMFIMF